MIHELSVFIAAEPGMADRLLRAHAPDRSGHCRGCSNGPATPRWPCTIHAAAAAARHRQAAEAEQLLRRSRIAWMRPAT